MKRIIATSALALLAGQALGQSFNVDLNNTSGNGAGAPAATYGGAAAQPGTWNSITSSTATTSTLVGLNGAASACSLTRDLDGAFAATFDSGVTGDNAKLLQDYQWIDGFGTLQYTVSNLQFGTYAVYTYGVKPGSDSNESGVTVTGTTSSYQYVGGNLANNSLIPGDSHAIHIVQVNAGGSIVIKVSDSLGGVPVIGGFQIRKIDSSRLRFYVDDSNAGTQNGTSWASAFDDLQTALNAAKNIGGLKCEIWTAQGFYYPTSGTDRSASFEIADGLHLYGGFNATETTLADRQNPWFYITAMSGSIGGSATTDNSYNVVDADNTGASTLIDGFSIANGRASGSDGEARGGGITLTNASPTIRNVKFLSNYASINGGGAHATGGQPEFVNCLFYNNSTGGSGAGIYMHTSGKLWVYNTEFGNNQATGNGGGISLNFCQAYLANCFFTGNTTSGGNGAGFQIAGNETDDATITNSTFSMNSSGSGTSGGVYANNQSDITLNNCILWGNTDNTGSSVANQQHRSNTNTGALISDTYTTIQGEDADPLFVDADGSNNNPGDADDDCTLQPGSPCIDAGNSSLLPTDGPDLDGDNNVFEVLSLDLDGNPRRRDVISAIDTGVGAPVVDRGCFEVQPCGPDFDGDGFLTGIDFDLFVQAYEAGEMTADWDQDGFITGIDFDLYTQAYELGC